jgi:DNA-binding response OmpR family regulator
MGRHVLVVEDEPNIVLCLSFLLEQAGYSVATAADGEEALAKARAQRPDTILLDIMLPGVDGYEVCQEIREDPDLAEVPIIILTARGRDVDREKGISLGATEYIVKPFSTADVLARVKAHCGSD